MLWKSNFFCTFAPNLKTANMKRTNLCVTLMSAVLCLSAQAADVKQVGNSVTIRPDGGQAKVIRLEVINDNIIRVRAT